MNTLRIVRLILMQDLALCVLVTLLRLIAVFGPVRGALIIRICQRGAAIVPLVITSVDRFGMIGTVRVALVMTLVDSSSAIEIIILFVAMTIPDVKLSSTSVAHSAGSLARIMVVARKIRAIGGGASGQCGAVDLRALRLRARKLGLGRLDDSAIAVTVAASLHLSFFAQSIEIMSGNLLSPIGGKVHLEAGGGGREESLVDRPLMGRGHLNAALSELVEFGKELARPSIS